MDATNTHLMDLTAGSLDGCYSTDDIQDDIIQPLQDTDSSSYGPNPLMTKLEHGDDVENTNAQPMDLAAGSPDGFYSTGDTQDDITQPLGDTDSSSYGPNPLMATLEHGDDVETTNAQPMDLAAGSPDGYYSTDDTQDDIIQPLQDTDSSSYGPNPLMTTLEHGDDVETTHDQLIDLAAGSPDGCYRTEDISSSHGPNAVATANDPEEAESSLPSSSGKPISKRFTRPSPKRITQPRHEKISPPSPGRIVQLSPEKRTRTRHDPIARPSSDTQPRE